MHMLRRRLGDERFCSMLRDMCEKYRFTTISTEQFRELLGRFAAPKSPDADFRIFFDTWVYGTGIPAVKLTHSIRGGKMTGMLTATGAGDDFSGLVPVELQQGRKKTTHWLHVSSDGSPFSIPLRQPVASVKIAVSSGDCLIAK
jgi:aminopeptidase N